MEELEPSRLNNHLTEAGLPEESFSLQWGKLTTTFAFLLLNTFDYDKRCCPSTWSRPLLFGKGVSYRKYFFFSCNTKCSLFSGKIQFNENYNFFITTCVSCETTITGIAGVLAHQGSARITCHNMVNWLYQKLPMLSSIARLRIIMVLTSIT